MSKGQVRFRWQLSEKQRELFESPARFRVGMMGRRFGKNELATAAAIDYAVRPAAYAYGADADPTVWWVGNTYTQTRKYGFQKILSKLPDRLIDGSAKRSAPFEIPLKTGGQIEFYSYDRPASLQGAGVDFLVIDEAAYAPESVWDNDLRPMLLDNDGGALFISRPVGENWFYDRYTWGADAGQPYAKPSQQREGWDSVHATSGEGPPSESEIERVRASTPDAIFRQQYLADPSSGGTLLTLDMLNSEPAEVLDGEDWNWHVAVDLGVEMSPTKARENDTDYWALAVVAEHPRHPEAYLCEVRRRRGQAPSAAAEWINDCLSWVPTRRVRYEKVQAQAWFETHLQEEGLEPIPHTPTASKEDRIIGLSVPFDNGQVRLLDWSDVPGKTMDWSEFRTEWAGFPSGKVDQLDAVAQALTDVNFGARISGEGMDLYGRDADV